MLPEALIAVREFMQRGGDVLWLILGTLFLMWVLILERLYYFYRVHPDFSAAIQEEWNKRRDRLLQVAVLGSGLYLAASSVRLLARLALSTPAARRTSLIGAAAVAVAGLAAKALSFFERGMAPADVLTKTNSSPVATKN